MDGYLGGLKSACRVLVPFEGTYAVPFGQLYFQKGSTSMCLMFRISQRDRYSPTSLSWMGSYPNSNTTVTLSNASAFDFIELLLKKFNAKL